MGYPTKVQLINRKRGANQFYINFPTAIAEAMDFQKGELVYWHVQDRANLVLHRANVPPGPVTLKKTLRNFSKASTRS